MKKIAEVVVVEIAVIRVRWLAVRTSGSEFLRYRCQAPTLTRTSVQRNLFDKGIKIQRHLKEIFRQKGQYP